MNLEILISTCNSRVLQVQDVLLPVQIDVTYLIVHQVFDYLIEDSVQESIDSLAKRSDVRFVSEHSRGLSKNRNVALRNAIGDILLVSDDDARYTKEGLRELLLAFESNPSSDIITFRIATPDNERYKNYKSLAFKHSKISVLGVSSLEIAIRRKSLDLEKLKFEEQFGLGAKYPACEEAVFLARALKLGLAVSYEPVDIVIHPLESSGLSWSTDDSVRVRGALFRQMFGIAGYPLLLAFTLKQYTGYSHRYSLFQFLQLSGESFFRFKPKSN